RCSSDRQGLDPAFSLLQTIPYIGEIRAAQLLAFVAMPGRFRSVRQFWSYAGLGVERRVSGEHRVQEGSQVRNDKRRGGNRLKRNSSHPAKECSGRASSEELRLGSCYAGGPTLTICHPELHKAQNTA